MARDNRRIISLIGIILMPVLRALTPRIEEEMEKFLLMIHGKALETDNPIDDMFTGFLLDMFDIPHPE